MFERGAFEREGRAIPAPLEAPLDDGNVISFVSVGPAIRGTKCAS